MKNIAASPIKKAFGISLVITVVAGAVFGVSYVAQNKTTTEQAALASEAQQTVASVQNDNAVLGEQTTKNGGYQVTATQVSNDTAYTGYRAVVTNLTTDTLQFSPGLQFKLVGSTTGTVRTIVVPTGTTVFAGGPIAPNTSLTGNIYFATIPSESVSLHFIPDISTTAFIVVQ